MKTILNYELKTNKQSCMLDIILYIVISILIVCCMYGETMYVKNNAKINTIPFTTTIAWGAVDSTKGW